MSALVILMAFLLAAAGAMAAEWIRLRRSLHAGIAPSYGTAATIAVTIVLGQVIWNSLGVGDPGVNPAGSLAYDILIVVVIGPVLHGVTWLLILLGWESVRAALAEAAKPGRRPPRP